MLVDSHCHLEYEGLVEDQAGALDRAREAGVQSFLNISTKQAEWAQVVGTARATPDVYASVGIHPHNADDHVDLTREELRAATDEPKVIGIGETGLDYYYDHSDREAQQRLFRLHIDVAREVQLPVIIHTRDAEDDTLAILQDEMGKGNPNAETNEYGEPRPYVDPGRGGQPGGGRPSARGETQGEGSQG